MSLTRRRYQLPDGSYQVPADAWVDALEATVSRGLSELCCRINTDARSFAKAAATLARAAQVRVSEETVRQVVLAEGQKVAAALTAGTLPPVWQASECRIQTPQGQEVSRVYASMDGVQTPVVAEAEKKKRRAKVVARRKSLRRKGKKLRPLPPRKPGADGPWKEVKVAACYDQSMAKKHVRATPGNHHAIGRMLAQATAQLRFNDADEAIGNGDGGPWVIGQFRLRRIALPLDYLHHLHQIVHCHRLGLPAFVLRPCQVDAAGADGLLNAGTKSLPVSGKCRRWGTHRRRRLRRRAGERQRRRRGIFHISVPRPDHHLRDDRGFDCFHRQSPKVRRRAGCLLGFGLP